MKSVKSSVCLLLSSLIFIQVSLAGETGTHGGQGVVCKNASGRITSVQIADYYEEMNSMYNAVLDPGTDTSSYMAVVEHILGNLSKVDALAASRFLDRAKTFESEAGFSPNPLTLIDDAHPPVQPQVNCTMAQFALQNYPIKPLQKKYLVDKNIWDSADSIAKAGLVLHEVIYTDALSLGQTSSQNTRYYNYIISSTAIQGMTSDTYLSVLKAAGLTINPDLFSTTGMPATAFSSLFFKANSISGTPENRNGEHFVDYMGVVESGTVRLFDGSAIPASVLAHCLVPENPVKNQTLCDFMPTENSEHSMGSFRVKFPTVDGRLEVGITADGKLLSGQLVNDEMVKLGDNNFDLMKDSVVSVYPSGQISEFCTSEVTEISILNHLFKVSCLNESSIEFFKDGTIEGITFKDQFSFQANGQNLQTAGGFSFNEDGSINKVVVVNPTGGFSYISNGQQTTADNLYCSGDAKTVLTLLRNHDGTYIVTDKGCVSLN